MNPKTTAREPVLVFRIQEEQFGLMRPLPHQHGGPASRQRQQLLVVDLLEWVFDGPRLDHGDEVTTTTLPGRVSTTIDAGSGSELTKCNSDTRLSAPNPANFLR